MQRKRERALITPKLRGFSRLPPELIIKILLMTNLDVIELVKYRCVNKLWQALIDSIMPKILEQTIWTISLLKRDLIVLILGDIEFPVNGSRIWTGEGGKVSRQIYKSLTGSRLVGRVEPNKKISLRQRSRNYMSFVKDGWIRCVSVRSDNAENIDGLVQFGISCDSGVLLDDESSDDKPPFLGDYDLTQYLSDLSDDDIYF